MRSTRTRMVLHRDRIAEAVAEVEAALEGALTITNDMFCTTALLDAMWAARDRGDPVAAARYGEQALTHGTRPGRAGDRIRGALSRRRPL